jgi:hypothetical protein
MISLWFLGDGGRFLYYVWSKAPMQFQIGGILTVAMDAVVLIQFFMWRHKLIEDDMGDHSIDMEGDMTMEKSQVISNVSL